MGELQLDRASSVGEFWSLNIWDEILDRSRVQPGQIINEINTLSYLTVMYEIASQKFS